MDAQDLGIHHLRNAQCGSACCSIIDAVLVFVEEGGCVAEGLTIIQ